MPMQPRRLALVLLLAVTGGVLLPDRPRPQRQRGQWRLHRRSRRFLGRPRWQQQLGLRRQRRFVQRRQRRFRAAAGGASAGSGGSSRGQRWFLGGQRRFGSARQRWLRRSRRAAAARGGSGGSGGSATDGSTAPEASSGTDTNSTGGPCPPGMRKVVILHDANAGGSANDPSRKSMMDVLNSMKELARHRGHADEQPHQGQ